MNDDSRLLDEIIVHLRSEQVPEMPTELATSRTSKPRSWPWYLVPIAALAASIVGVLVWYSYAVQSLAPRVPMQVQHPSTDIRESGVIVQTVDLAKPLTQLETNLASMDVEIAELQRKAALLDARRTADELLAQY